MTAGNEAVEHVEGDGRYREEVYRGDGLPMVVKKSEPALGGLRGLLSSFHVSRDRSLGNLEASHEKLTVDEPMRLAPFWPAADKMLRNSGMTCEQFLTRRGIVWRST